MSATPNGFDIKGQSETLGSANQRGTFKQTDKQNISGVFKLAREIAEDTAEEVEESTEDTVISYLLDYLTYPKSRPSGSNRDP